MTMQWKRLLNTGRAKPSTGSDDLRLQFERDYDRAIFSNPVRRLQDKAQVFLLESNDAVRTRLTHSLEVSTVARNLAAQVCRDLLSRGCIEPGQDRQIESIAATCGLLHDLGNPPFGHSGETAIQDWFKKRPESDPFHLKLQGQTREDFLRFDGNAQTLRIISKLQILSHYNGLNLTFGTLSAVCKYTASSNEAGKDHPDHAKAKTGYFASENLLIGNIRAETGTGGARNPITFLVEAADDIVYSVADIEDAVKKKVLSWDALQAEINQAAALVPCICTARDRKDHILKEPPSSLTPLSGDSHATAFRTAAIGVMVDSAAKEFIRRYDAIMNGQYLSELMKDCDAKELVAYLKKTAWDHVYSTYPNLKLELMGRKIITDLMDIFWESACCYPVAGIPQASNFPGKIGRLFSSNYIQAFQHALDSNTGLPPEYHRYQLVTDYVCGMTDSFAQHLHKELTNA